jgi:hypothetical protein
MDEIYKLGQNIFGNCCICFHRNVIGRPHITFKCAIKTCANEQWKSFKKLIPFPTPLKICVFCFTPSASGNPFHDGSLCKFPDVLKELTWIIFQDKEALRAIFSILRRSVPVSVDGYKRYLGQCSENGILGVHEVLHAYTVVRGQGL